MVVTWSTLQASWYEFWSAVSASDHEHTTRTDALATRTAVASHWMKPVSISRRRRCC